MTCERKVRTVPHVTYKRKVGPVPPMTSERKVEPVPVKKIVRNAEKDVNCDSETAFLQVSVS